MIRKLAFSLIVVLLSASPGFASEDCESSCPDGQVRVSFADGNNAQCLCAPAGEGMVPTDAQEIDCSDPEDDGTCE